MCYKPNNCLVIYKEKFVKVYHQKLIEKWSKKTYRSVEFEYWFFGDDNLVTLKIDNYEVVMIINSSKFHWNVRKLLMHQELHQCFCLWHATNVVDLWWNHNIRWDRSWRTFQFKKLKCSEHNRFLQTSFIQWHHKIIF